MVNRKITLLTDCPCCGQKLPSREYIVDEHHRIVMRDGKAVAIPIGQFAIFLALFRSRRLLSMQNIIAEVYRGSEAPLTAANSIYVMIREINKKLQYLGMRIVATHPGPNAFWRLEQ